eukprot:gene2879-65374_t
MGSGGKQRGLRPSCDPPLARRLPPLPAPAIAVDHCAGTPWWWLWRRKGRQPPPRARTRPVCRQRPAGQHRGSRAGG